MVIIWLNTWTNPRILLNSEKNPICFIVSKKIIDLRVTTGVGSSINNKV
jgi:hypothetical protein